MSAAIAAQWLAWRKRPMLKVMVLVYMAMVALQFLAPILLVRLMPQLAQLGAEEALDPAAMEGLKATITFPGAWATLFGQVNGVGGLFLMIVGASSIAAEYPWGVARGLLARQPSRGRYLAIRAITLLLMAALLVLISLPLGLVLGLGASVALEAPIALAPGDVLFLARHSLIAWVALVPYCALALATATIARSPAAAITLTIGFWLLEIGLGFVSILRVLGELGVLINTFTLGQSVGAWTNLIREETNLVFSDTVSQLGVAFPDLVRASLQIILYTGLFYGLAWWYLQRRDVRR